jgi:hypothetical protein
MKKQKESEWTLIGHCGVDSGHLVLVDPCYIMPSDTRKLEDDQMDYGQLHKSLFGKDGIGPESKELVFSGIAGNGVVFSSGIGDGNYPVYAKIVDDETFGRRVAEVKVVMMPHPYFE